ncbi:MAG: hypothetical protein JWO31_1845 [Phycisphaerales bacterium]|nr:hypothetical protein [Phycisphaerales bacterium]
MTLPPHTPMTSPLPVATAPTDRRPLATAGLLLGVGLGGFVDGILFHQILQIHNMLSARRPKDSVANMEVNMFWDGLFHAFTWLCTAAGVWVLFRAGRRADVPWSGRLLLGATLGGWGLFNLVEGVIDHHLLQVHHVAERYGLSAFDYAFLAFGAVLTAVGWGLGRSASGQR